jgi:Holliday junction resolvase
LSEAKYQSKLIKKYEAEGYYVIKLISTNKAGIPDIVALKPDDVKFIEVKGKLTKVSPLQEYRIRELKKLGFDATIERE